MKIKIKYFNILREAAGTKEEFYSFSSIPAIQTALKEACSRHNSALKEKLFEESGKVKPAILIFLNSQLVNCDRLDQKLSDNDELYLFPIISGG